MAARKISAALLFLLLSYMCISSATRTLFTVEGDIAGDAVGAVEGHIPGAYAGGGGSGSGGGGGAVYGPGGEHAGGGAAHAGGGGGGSGGGGAYAAGGEHTGRYGGGEGSGSGEGYGAGGAAAFGGGGGSSGGGGVVMLVEHQELDTGVVKELEVDMVVVQADMPTVGAEEVVLEVEVATLPEVAMLVDMEKALGVGKGVVTLDTSLERMY
ncbi:hypothetical protein Nepgr_028605 [Nepenthes gracilis]|uniref:Glycine-rich protein n=1 Tax=Nepenthes gracilis TaxID=150966 RepID=A0AAD3TE48_NEPGR|nr:hypothetical protein Nepgr_028605 [Nepenthes gracilis]